MDREVYDERFHQRFRGGFASVLDRLDRYSPLLRGMDENLASIKAIDLGCGRGEWLAVLARNGMCGIGVDTSARAVRRLCDGGREAIHSDALTYLKSRESDSASLITCFHLVEHVRFSDLLELLVESHRVLVPGGMFIAETPNPENLVVGTHTFHLDPTHRHPVPPELLAFVMEQTGLTELAVIRLNGDRPTEPCGPLESAMAALLLGCPDYACVGIKPQDHGDMDTRLSSYRAALAKIETEPPPDPRALVAAVADMERRIAQLERAIATQR